MLLDLGRVSRAPPLETCGFEPPRLACGESCFARSGAEVGCAAVEARPVIEVTGVGKQFARRRDDDGVCALDDVSFTIAGHGIVGILGPNGAGKTTLLDILEGLTA